MISSSDDESDQIEERAKFLLSSRDLSATKTPPRNGPSPTRHGRPRRVLSGRSSDSSMDPNLLKRKQSTISPTKTTSSALNSSAQMRSKRIDINSLDLTMTRVFPVPSPKHRSRQGTDGSIAEYREVITSDSDEILTPARRKCPMNPSKPKVSDEDSDDIRGPASSSKRRALHRKLSVVSMSDQRDSSSDDVVTSPIRKRRLRKAPEPSMASNTKIDGESEELQEDLEDLKGTGKSRILAFNYLQLVRFLHNRNTDAFHRTAQ